MTVLQTTIGDWKPHGAHGSKNTQVFAIGDVHGQADLLAETLKVIGKIVRSADVRRLIFLGDVIDRGPANLWAIGLVQHAAQLAAVDDVVLLPGNHELMLLDGLDAPLMHLSDWLDNGGDTLIQEADPCCSARTLVELAEIARAAVGDAFLNRIRTGPTWHAERDLLFVHAGVSPYQDIRTFLNKPRLLALDSDHWAWIREPFLDWKKGWNGRVIIHGHTPAVRSAGNLEVFAAQADHIAKRRRLCLDAGAAFQAQLGWAEFSALQYRLGLTRSMESPSLDLVSSF